MLRKTHRIIGGLKDKLDFWNAGCGHVLIHTSTVDTAWIDNQKHALIVTPNPIKKILF